MVGKFVRKIWIFWWFWIVKQSSRIILCPIFNRELEFCSIFFLSWLNENELNVLTFWEPSIWICKDFFLSSGYKHLILTISPWPILNWNTLITICMFMINEIIPNDNLNTLTTKKLKKIRCLLFGLFQAYGFAWISHFFVELNRPATFKYPVYSFISDWVMFKDALFGRVSLFWSLIFVRH